VSLATWDHTMFLPPDTSEHTPPATIPSIRNFHSGVGLSHMLLLPEFLAE